MVTTKYYIGKYASYCGIGFLFMLLQNIPAFATIPAIKPMLVFALAVVVAVIEKETIGSVFAIYCGFICDMFSDYSFGYYALFLYILCMGIGILCRGFVRPSAINSAFFTFISMVIVQWLAFFFTVFIVIDGATYQFFITHFLPLCIYTTIYSLPIFMLIDKIWVYFQKKIDLA